jgi:hypothetical protein
MTPNGLELDTANKSQGLELIPAGALVELIMRIKAGNLGIDSLCKRSSKGDSEGIDVEYTVKDGESDGRKAVRLPAARRRDGWPRQGRRDHAIATARNLRGSQRHRSE